MGSPLSACSKPGPLMGMTLLLSQPPLGISCVANTLCPDSFLTGYCHRGGIPEPQTALPSPTLM